MSKTNINASSTKAPHLDAGVHSRFRHSDFEFDSSFVIRISDFAAKPRRAFTLVEMMVVVSIIVLVLAVLHPAMNSLMGNNGIAGAENQISAMLGVARADALYNRQMTGVMVFIDPTTNQVGLIEVVPNPARPVPNQFSNYAYYNSAVTATVVIQTSLEIALNRDALLLPADVGVALYNRGTGTGFDRYLRVGVIMFGPDGTVISIPYGVETGTVAAGGTRSNLATRMGLLPLPPTVPQYDLYGYNELTSGTTLPLKSQLGILLYNRKAFAGQRSINTASGPLQFSDVDLEYPQILPSTASFVLPGTAAEQLEYKQEEEAWLDSNGTSLLVSPNGDLIKAKG